MSNRIQNRDAQHDSADRQTDERGMPMGQVGYALHSGLSFSMEVLLFYRLY